MNVLKSRKDCITESIILKLPEQKTFQTHISFENSFSCHLSTTKFPKPDVRKIKLHALFWDLKDNMQRINLFNAPVMHEISMLSLFFHSVLVFRFNFQTDLPHRQRTSCLKSHASIIAKRKLFS